VHDKRRHNIQVTLLCSDDDKEISIKKNKAQWEIGGEKLAMNREYSLGQPR